MDSLSRKIAVIDDTAIIMEGKKNKHIQRCLEASENTKSANGVDIVRK